MISKISTRLYATKSIHKKVLHNKSIGSIIGLCLCGVQVGCSQANNRLLMKATPPPIPPKPNMIRSEKQENNTRIIQNSTIPTAPPPSPQGYLTPKDEDAPNASSKETLSQEEQLQTSRTSFEAELQEKIARRNRNNVKLKAEEDKRETLSQEEQLQTSSISFETELQEKIALHNRNNIKFKAEENKGETLSQEKQLQTSSISFETELQEKIAKRLNNIKLEENKTAQASHSLVVVQPVVQMSGQLQSSSSTTGNPTSPSLPPTPPSSPEGKPSYKVLSNGKRIREAKGKDTNVLAKHWLFKKQKARNVEKETDELIHNLLFKKQKEASRQWTND